MENFWSRFVDEVAFVDYNPWENAYDSEKTLIEAPVQIFGGGCLFGGMEKLHLVMLIILLRLLKRILTIRLSQKFGIATAIIYLDNNT